MFVWNFMTTSLSIAEILFFNKNMIENCRRQNANIAN